ncbi:hypothetical protein RLIN73S_01073 [Rhodanobacter lindaniclasticus]
MSYRRVIGLLAMTALMAACGRESGNANVVSFRSGGVVTGDIALRKDGVALHAPGVPEALIDAAGDLNIDQQPTTVNPAQRALLQDYYRNVLAMNDHAIAKDVAGAVAAGQAAKSIARDVANGDVATIDNTSQAKSPRETEAALKTCQDLAGIKAAQDGLAGQLAAFKPYAGIIQTGNLGGCESPTDQHG